MTFAIRRYCGTIAAVAAGALLLSACGTIAGGKSTAKASLHDQLPDAIKKAGVIHVGASYTAAPVIFQNQAGQPDGLDADLASAMEKELGVKFEFQDVGPFSNVLPGLFDKKYDIGWSGITDSREREKGLDSNGKPINEGLDFVDYFMAGIGMAVKKGNPAKVAKLDDLCGHSVAVKKGTVHATLAASQAKACDHTKIGGLKIVELDSDQKALDAVKTGEADAYLTDYPKAVYAATSTDNGQTFEIAFPQQLQPRPYGIALRKSDTVLRDVLSRAMDKLVVNGTYDDILKKRNLTIGAVENAVINGST